MRFLIPTTSLNLHPQRFHTFAAIGTGVATTAISVGGSMLASNLSGGGGQSSGGLPKFTSTFSPVEFSPVSNVSYNAGQGAQDLLSMFPALSNFAKQATAFQTKEREKVMPGAGQRFQEASNVLGSWLTGEVPQDVVSFTNRAVAERTGGTFNPSTGGGKSQVDFARSIGKLSSDFTKLGVSSAPAWLQLADSFVVKPLDVADRSIALNQVRYQYDALNTDINQFNSGTDLETQMFNASGVESGALSEYYSKRDQAYAAQAAQLANQSNAANLASTMTGLAGTGVEAYLKTQNNTVGEQSNPKAARPLWVRYPGQSAWEQPS